MAAMKSRLAPPCGRPRSRWPLRPRPGCVGQRSVGAELDPLPSWNDGATKQAIVDFVHATTDQSSPRFVPPDDRIATFDQDGTLWVVAPDLRAGRLLPGSGARPS